MRNGMKRWIPQRKPPARDGFSRGHSMSHSQEHQQVLEAPKVTQLSVRLPTRVHAVSPWLAG